MFHCMTTFKKMQISFRIIRKGVIVSYAIVNGLKDPVSGMSYLRMLGTLNRKKANCLVFSFLLNTGDIFPSSFLFCPSFESKYQGRC